MIWVGLVALVGISFWISGGYLWYRERGLRARGVRASGEVVRIQETQDTEGDPLFLRVARFNALDGRSIEFTDSMPTRTRDRYAIGEKVAVLYDPSDVGHARIDPGGTRASGLVVLFVMGLVFVVLAGLALRFG